MTIYSSCNDIILKNNKNNAIISPTCMLAFHCNKYIYKIFPEL